MAVRWFTASFCQTRKHASRNVSRITARLNHSPRRAMVRDAIVLGACVRLHPRLVERRLGYFDSEQAGLKRGSALQFRAPLVQ